MQSSRRHRLCVQVRSCSLCCRAHQPRVPGEWHSVASWLAKSVPAGQNRGVRRIPDMRRAPCPTSQPTRQRQLPLHGRARHSSAKQAASIQTRWGNHCATVHTQMSSGTTCWEGGRRGGAPIQLARVGAKHQPAVPCWGTRAGGCTACEHQTTHLQAQEQAGFRPERDDARARACGPG